MNKKKLIILEKILLLGLIFYVPVDIMNGFLIEKFNISISLFYKFSIVFLMILLSVNKKIVQYFIIINILILLFLIHFLISENFLISVLGLDWMIKFMLIFISYLYFSSLNLKQFKRNSLIFIKYSFLFYAFNFIIGAFGFGYNTYSNNEGVKGFFYAMNEVAIGVLICGGILQMIFISSRYYLLFLFVSFLVIFIGVLSSTKVMFIGALIVFLYFLYIHVSDSINNKRINKKTFFLFITVHIILPILILFSFYYAYYLTNIFDRLQYFYNKLDILTFVFSNRNVYAKMALDLFLNNYNSIEILFGSGVLWTYAFNDINMVEIDLIDFLMSYGLFGVFITYGFYIFIVLKNQFKKRIYYRYTNIIMILVLCISLTAGHVLNSGHAGIFLGLLMSFCNAKRRKNEDIGSIKYVP